MPMKLEIANGDYVYCTARGVGSIHSFDNNSINIRFGSKVVSYGADSLAEYPSQERSLYWHNPFVIEPPRNREDWDRKKKVVYAVIEAMK